MIQPSVPRRDDFGRHTASSPLQAGWPCRWCLRPLRVVVNRRTLKPCDLTACGNCDQPNNIEIEEPPDD